jgi:hypothetical protein
MTILSRSASESLRRDSIGRIAEDLRRQRADLERLQASSDASSTETARIVEQIARLRRRIEGPGAEDGESGP